MSWFRQNRLLGAVLFFTGAVTVAAGWWVLEFRSDWAEAVSRFDLAAAELNRLEGLTPFPSEENLRKFREEAVEYAAAIERFTGELRKHAVPLAPMAPNEFQSRLRLVENAVAERARASSVRLPDKFHLGFDEFASSLPTERAAPLLGWELVQIEWLLDTFFEARVDALTSFQRRAARASSAPAGQKPDAGTGLAALERNVVEATIVSTPAAARKVLNQIAGSSQHFFVVRFWHVKNEKDKGPPREVGGENRADALPAGLSNSAATKSSSPGSINFIVGNERIETTMTIEIVRLAL